MMLKTLLAAALVAGSTTLVMAQAGGTSGAGSDVSTPRKGQTQSGAMKRSDDPMAKNMPMGKKKKSKKKSM